VLGWFSTRPVAGAARGAGTTTSPVTVPFRSSIRLVPTITWCLVKRYLLETPIYFPSSIYKTDKAILWRQFWFDQGLTLVGGSLC